VACRDGPRGGTSGGAGSGGESLPVSGKMGGGWRFVIELKIPTKKWSRRESRLTDEERSGMLVPRHRHRAARRSSRILERARRRSSNSAITARDYVIT